MIITPGAVLVNIGNQPLPFAAPPSQLRSFDAYYTRDPGSACGASVCLFWLPLSNSEISRYKVYRSVVGFEADKGTPALLAGKTLEVSLNLGPTQTITFDGTTPTVDRINMTLVGGYAASLEASPGRFALRVSPGSAPGMVQVLGGTALADLGVLAGTYSKESHRQLVANINSSPEDDTEGVEFCDSDGTIYDSYQVSTVDLSGVESRPTEYSLPTAQTGRLCRVYGCVSTAAGVRVPDSSITAKILEYPQSVVSPTFVDKEEVSALSDSQGRFEILLLRGAFVEISVPALCFRRTVLIPDQAEAALVSLAVCRDYRLALETYV